MFVVSLHCLVLYIKHALLSFRTKALAANLQLAQSRPGLGVPVLPPIAPPPSPQSSPVPIPRRHTPPPPYFTEQEAQRAATPPRPAPRARAASSSYSLPNPLPSMTEEERGEVESIAGMGFPPARVARVHRRYSGDRTKVRIHSRVCVCVCE